MHQSALLLVKLQFCHCFWINLFYNFETKNLVKTANVYTTKRLNFSCLKLSCRIQQRNYLGSKKVGHPLISKSIFDHEVDFDQWSLMDDRMIQLYSYFQIFYGDIIIGSDAQDDLMMKR